MNWKKKFEKETLFRVESKTGIRYYDKKPESVKSTECPNPFKLKRLTGIDDPIKSYAKFLELTRKLEINKYWANQLGCSRKQYDYTIGLTKESFLHLFKCEYYQVINWDVEVSERGLKYIIEGYYLIRRKHD